MAYLMNNTILNFASDNCAPVHPECMAAVIDANVGFTPSYGADPWTQEADQLIKSAFQKPAKIFFIPTGTGSNVLALKLACQRHHSVVCTDISHITYHESGAAESIVGCKLLTVPHHQGKIVPRDVIRKIKVERAFGLHSTLPRMLTIAQPTEVGTVYTLEELQELSALCKSENLLFHIDGSRFYNAIVSLDISLEDFARQVDVDMLSLGGTKNGLMGVESLIIFNPLLEEASAYLHKQTLQLMSKMRYLSAQFIPFIKKNLWAELAANANQKAARIAELIAAFPKFKLSYPVDSNQVFFIVPFEYIARLRERVNFNVWDAERNEVRFIASWNTSDDEIDALREFLEQIILTDD